MIRNWMRFSMLPHTCILISSFVHYSQMLTWQYYGLHIDILVYLVTTQRKARPVRLCPLLWLVGRALKPRCRTRECLIMKRSSLNILTLYLWIPLGTCHKQRPIYLLFHMILLTGSDYYH